MTRLSPDQPFLHADVTLTDTTFGRYTEVGQGSRIAHSDIGDYSYCDRYADIANASIGKFSNIASFVRIGATDHPMQGASLHHFLYRSADYFDDAENDAAFFAHRKSRRASIGHDTWIGHNAMIKPEVTVGHGAIVAAGAIVTHDVAPYTIVAGTPARVLRLRQSPKIATRLLALAWWDWSHDRLRAALPDFRDLAAEAFLEKYELQLA
ncbi:chloramphenicol acetyltransferase [Cognatishimia sp. SS12]|uniref:chloramphenicol acetyltransferase n=1 Tax=Cognatishimia sp. SS12 TaxID=2979465 RepID=UPI0023304F3C|nr:chloramphenicol acetyltransferase [Cognatishimia sp. SS12]MDC0738692.1 chloramphenicol acetyltransferase [Cognatishimia sp. SS12]